MSSSIKLFAASLMPHAASSSSARSYTGSQKVPTTTEPSVPEPDEGLDISLSESELGIEPMANISISTILREEVDLGTSTVRLVPPSRPKKTSSPPSSPEYANPSPYKGKPIVNAPPSSSQLHLPLFPSIPASSVDLFATCSSGTPVQIHDAECNPNFPYPRGPSTHQMSSSAVNTRVISSELEEYGDMDVTVVGGQTGLYPSLTPSTRSVATTTSGTFSLPGSFPEPPPRSYPAYAGPASSVASGLNIMSPEFTFRSPMHPKPTVEKTGSGSLAKETVLAEMRRRMLEEDSLPGSSSLSAEFSFVSAVGTKRARENEDEDETQDGKASTRISSVIVAKFEKAHQKQFDK